MTNKQKTAEPAPAIDKKPDAPPAGEQLVVVVVGRDTRITMTVSEACEFLNSRTWRRVF